MCNYRSSEKIYGYSNCFSIITFMNNSNNTFKRTFPYFDFNSRNQAILN